MIKVYSYKLPMFAILHNSTFPRLEQTNQTCSEEQEDGCGRFGSCDYKLEAIKIAGVGVKGIVNPQPPGAVGIPAVKDLQQAAGSRSESAGKRRFALLNRKLCLIIKYGLFVICTLEKLIKRIIHIQTQTEPIGALQKDLQIKDAGVR